MAYRSGKEASSRVKDINHAMENKLNRLGLRLEKTETRIMVGVSSVDSQDPHHPLFSPHASHRA